MRYHLRHVTTYDYADSVLLCHNIVHLLPRTTTRQKTLAAELLIEPEPKLVQKQEDYFGNVTHFFAVQEPHQQLTIVAEHDTEVLSAHDLASDLSGSPAWEEVVLQLKRARLLNDLAAYEFTFDSHYVKRQREWGDYALSSFPPGRPLLEGVMALTSRIYHEFKYDPRSTTIATPLRDVYLRRRGVCQDFAHFQIACLRTLGLAARYVSGYLQTTPPPGQPRLIGADASHAWLQVYCPQAGWLDFDPTNNLRPSEKHIIVAWGRDYDDVSPVKGIILGGEQHTISVSVDVEPLQA